MPHASKRLAAPAVLLSAMLLTACASEGSPDVGPGRDARRHGRPHEGGEHPARSGQASLFVSPSGEPFRAAAGEPYPVARWFAQADLNHDGRLDRAEFRADAERFFATLDLNGDGVLEQAEVARYERDLVPEILAGAGRLSSGTGGGRRGRRTALGLAQPGGGGFPGGGGGGGGFPGSGGGGGGGGRHGGGGGEDSSSERREAPAGDDDLAGAAPYDMLREPEPVTAADLDFNGRITLAEFRTRADQRFRLLDPDDRGYLTPDDLPKTAVQEGGPRPRRRP